MAVQKTDDTEEIRKELLHLRATVGILREASYAVIRAPRWALSDGPCWCELKRQVAANAGTKHHTSMCKALKRLPGSLRYSRTAHIVYISVKTLTEGMQMGVDVNQEEPYDRKTILLKVCLDMLKKCHDRPSYPTETTVFYDDADCDGYCLMDDIEAELQAPKLCAHNQNPKECQPCRIIRDYLNDKLPLDSAIKEYAQATGFFPLGEECICSVCGFPLHNNQQHTVGDGTELCSHVRGQ